MTSHTLASLNVATLRPRPNSPRAHPTVALQLPTLKRRLVNVTQMGGPPLAVPLKWRQQPTDLPTPVARSQRNVPKANALAPPLLTVNVKLKVLRVPLHRLRRRQYPFSLP